MGLQRTNSNDGRPSATENHRRPGFSQDEKLNSEEVAERKSSIQAEFIARKNSTVIEETIPEVAVDTPGPVGSRPGLLSERTSYMNGKKAVKETTPSEIVLSKSLEKIVSTAEDKSGNVLPASLSKIAVSGAATMNGKSGSAEAPIGNTEVRAKPVAAKTNGKPASIVTKTPTTSKPVAKPVKSPGASKAITSPKPVVASPKPTPASNSTEAKAGQLISKPPRTSTSSIGPPPKKITTQAKPRSPTRPVKLPSSLTAPTASSLQKTDASSNSAHLAPGKAVPRSSSRVGASPASAPGPRAKSAARPSLGRPSVGSVKEKNSPPKKEVREADDSFLARMMRPTTASKSKVQDRIEPASPPRKLAATPHVTQSKERPVTRDGPPKATSYGASNLAAPKLMKQPEAAKMEIAERKKVTEDSKEKVPEKTAEKVQEQKEEKLQESKEEPQPLTPEKVDMVETEANIAPATESSSSIAPLSEALPLPDKTADKPAGTIVDTENDKKEEPVLLIDPVEPSTSEAEIKEDPLASIKKEPEQPVGDHEAQETPVATPEKAIEQPKDEPKAQESLASGEEPEAPLSDKLETLELKEDASAVEERSIPFKVRNLETGEEEEL